VGTQGGNQKLSLRPLDSHEFDVLVIEKKHHEMWWYFVPSFHSLIYHPKKAYPITLEDYSYGDSIDDTSVLLGGQGQGAGGNGPGPGGVAPGAGRRSTIA